MDLSNGNSRLDECKSHWHFIGILGSGMQALARYAIERGARVTGSDLQPSPALDDLTRRGAVIQLNHENTILSSSADLVVFSQAIAEDNPELASARRMGVEAIRYPELLGNLMERQPGIAVAGSHGKSTTAGMVAYVLRRVGMDPSYVIGADVPQLGGASRYGAGPYLVAEACEYKRSFLYLCPRIGVVTNVDLEHMDYYYDLVDIQEAFRSFAEGIDPDGALVVNADDGNTRGIADAAECRVMSYGIKAKGAEYRAERIWRAKKHTNFNLTFDGKDYGRFSVQLYGTHNVYNTLAAMGALHRAGVEFDQMRGPIAEFEGAARRLQLLGEPWNVAVVSDFAHHPNEIKASLAATQQRFPHRRVFCVFQPHQYSRTRTMLEELAEAFRGAWLTLVTDIYAARDTEQDMRSVSAADLVQLMNHKGMTAHYVPDFKDIDDIMVGDVVPRDVVLVMGAGNIFEVAHNVVPRIDAKGRKQLAA
ncbi:MAG: UDP-N-acetylmuramate--L-alanine ligase [Candidatus Brocadiia bacterium]|jgi:UDP-N-acetylmuramate--alanine ligase|nr:UDP-N-acetylmuramate--L-alanine ligase [Candidatus Brocadiia bacterium]